MRVMNVWLIDGLLLAFGSIDYCISRLVYQIELINVIRLEVL